MSALRQARDIAERYRDAYLEQSARVSGDRNKHTIALYVARHRLAHLLPWETAPEIHTPETGDGRDET